MCERNDAGNCQCDQYGWLPDRDVSDPVLLHLQSAGLTYKSDQRADTDGEGA